MSAESDSATDDPLDGMIPQRENIFTVNPTQSAQDFFAEQCSKPYESRPAVICLDARKTNVKNITDWLRDFDHCDGLQPHNEGDSRFSPLRVIVLASEADAMHLPPDIAQRGDIDWIEANESDTRDIAEIYPTFVATSLRELMSTPRDAGLSQEPSPDALPPERFISKERLPEWKQRLQELERK